MCRSAIRALGLVVCALSAAPPVLADAATHLVVETPSVVAPNEAFTVRVYAVDAFGNVDTTYDGSVVGLATAESPPTPALRMATLVSGSGAATSIPPGSELRLALNGEGFRDYTLAPAATGADVCQSLEDTVLGSATEAYRRNVEFDCAYDAVASRYVLSVGEQLPAKTNMDEHYREYSALIDPAFGVAPLLGFGSSLPPPFAPSSFVARRLVAEPAIDLVFHAGTAAFRTTWTDLDDTGPGKSVVVDQGAAGLPVVSSTFEVAPPGLRMTSATALGDGTGRINRVRVTFSRKIDPVSLGGQESSFSLELGPLVIAGTDLALVDEPGVAYARDSIEVTFGSGLGRTDVTNVEVKYTPPAQGTITSLDGVSALDTVVPPLVDGAAPVIVNTFGQDVDGNGGLDRAVFTFSEPVAFSGARGVSVSGFEPVTSTTSLVLNLPASLRLVVDGVEQTVPLLDPDNSGATTIDGVTAIARAVTYAARHVPHQAAYSHFVAVPDTARNRLVLVSGTTGAGSEVVVQATAGGDAAPSLRLGTANGGVERHGSGNAIADLDDLVLLAEDGLHSMLEGQTESALTILGSQVEAALTNVPNSGTGTPTYLWKDVGDLGFLADRASVPNRMAPSNNVGLPAEFHPSELIRFHDTDSAPEDGVLTSLPGPVALDATPSVIPLLARHDSGTLTFLWEQVSGPIAVAIDGSDEPLADTELLQAGAYVFQLVVTAHDSNGLPVFSADWTADGTLTDRVSAVVSPGPPQRAVILLPNQDLNQGVHTHAEAVGGPPYLATPGVPFVARVTCSDAFFNVVSCPAATASLETTEPGGVTAPSTQPLVGTEVHFTVVPATPGAWELDDVLTGLPEIDDVAALYSTGTPWNAIAAKVEGTPATIHLTWDADPRPVRWNVYAGALPIVDDDNDGLPDDGYGTCVSTVDPDPHDTVFEDAALPAPDTGVFYVGTMTLDGQETLPGTTSAGQVRAVAAPCP